MEDLCAADQAYLTQWQDDRLFLDEDNLEIEVKETSKGWRMEEDGREVKGTGFEVMLTNHGAQQFQDVYVEYCYYRDRIDYIKVENKEVGMATIPANDKANVPVRGPHHASFRKGTTFLNEVVGARFRFTFVTTDGTELMRDACTRNELPLDNFPWKEGKRAKALQKADAKDPAAYARRKLKKSEIKALTNQYIQSFMNNDYAAWEKLMFPMHPGSRKLDDNEFKSYVNLNPQISIEDIETWGAKLNIHLDRYGDKSGCLLLSPSGYIKYTPLILRHPTDYAMEQVHLLMSEHRSWRVTARSRLKDSGVPVFDYDPDASKKLLEKETRRIMEWLKDHGQKHDTSEPAVTMPNDNFRASLQSMEEEVEKRF